MSEDKLPKPLTPPDADLSGVEPPWDLFEGMAVVQFGISQEQAREYVTKIRAEYSRKKALN